MATGSFRSWVGGLTNTAERGAEETAGGVFLDPELLKRLKSSGDPDVAALAWLNVMMRLNPALAQGVVVLPKLGQTSLRPAAISPEGAQPVPEMMRAVEAAVKSKRIIVETRNSDAAAIGTPLQIDGQVRGAIGFLTDSNADTDLRLLMDQVQWGSGWFEALMRRRLTGDQKGLETVVELLATSLHHKRFKEAATAVATELAREFGCELVSIGLSRRSHVRVHALSNSASFGKQATLVRAIEAAMDEAADQQSVVVYPLPNDAADRVVRAHVALSEREGQGNICTVPLTSDGRVKGGLMLMRDKGTPFSTADVRLAEHAAVLLGPILDVKRREDRWLISKAFASVGNLLGALFGRRHAALKLVTVLLLAAALFCWFATGTYRVVAESVVEGEIQRAVVAPLGGFLSEARVRAGDTVRAGEVMARIDDRDLRLERLRWSSQKSQQTREYSEAIAQRERTQARILQSQIEQADAQLELLDKQIARMAIAAPFDGVVVSGDLTQALGAPLERGDVLFEVAPLDSYRVMLRVDERDVRDIEVGQSGALVLSALTQTPYRIEVQSITPISVAEQGENFFFVEADVIEGPVADLRPGMQGVAKVDVDERRLVWIWTKRLVLWARMTLWSWWP